MARKAQEKETQETQLAEKPKTFSMVLTESLDSIEEALPVGFNKVRFVQEGVSLLNENNQLANFAKQYGTAQIKLGMLKAAYLGLSFQSKECYLVPYGNQLNFMVDYKGSVKLAKRYSTRPIKEIYAKVVKAGDTLDIGIEDGIQKVNFKPLALNDGEIVGVFAVCQFVDGGLLVETMTKSEIEKARNQSKAKNSVPWQNFYGEMSKKTVLHRLCKMIDLDYESVYQRSITEEEFAENPNEEVTDVFEDTQEVVDVMEGELNAVNE